MKVASEVPRLNVQRLRADFPILNRKVHGKRLVYLDSAATTQKPEAVIEALSHYYRTFNANIHRGIHSLAEEATEAYEQTRRKVASFIGGVEPRSIIFTRNATEGLNLVAYAWGRHHVRSGDEILLTEMEHHSNLVPWILLAREKGAVLKHIPITDEGELRLDCLSDLMTARTKVVSVTLVSNVLGTINPVREIADAAHRYGALMVVDGAQGVPHLPVDVRALDCDFLAFSGHKMLGPTGVGVLYGRPELLMNMEPFLGGGEMIREVRLDRATWNDIPWKFEAGTPNIADVVAFSAALDYLEAVGMDAVRAHEVELTGYGLERLLSLGWIKIYGPRDPDRRGGVLAFNDPEIHAHDLSTILDQYGIAIRAGHHCAQPLMRRLGAAATSRASFYLYNDRDDIDALVEALIAAGKYFGRNTRVNPAG